MNSVVKINNLEKSYGTHHVLKGISFEVKKGEIFALLGINGAGKTTTLECIEGLRKNTGGSIEVDGKMGIQLQSASLPEHIRAMEAIKLFAGWNKSEIDRNLLKTLGIGEMGKRNYINLSTGQKRRLHLALALISNPDIVVLDEPTAGLDVEGRVALHQYIRTLKAQEKTIVLASHDMAEVESLCDRIAILNDGKLVFMGTVDELTEKVGKHYLITVRLAAGEDLPERQESYEADDIGETLFGILKDYNERGVTVLDIKVDRGSLEQHFINIAGREVNGLQEEV